MIFYLIIIILAYSLFIKFQIKKIIYINIIKNKKYKFKLYILFINIIHHIIIENYIKLKYYF